MDIQTFTLLEYEMEALLASLRRDLISETQLENLRPEWADYHRLNARMSKRLLEAINPKLARNIGQSHKPIAARPTSESSIAIAKLPCQVATT